MAVCWRSIGPRLMKHNISYYDFYEHLDNDHDDILYGLTNSKQKKINSKYFYNELGSDLFDKITKLEDYYPTKKELQIIDDNNEKFYQMLPSNSLVIEFGSGSNIKIKKLLKALNNPEEYIAIDICREFLFKNAEDSAKKFPDLKVKAVCADFAQIGLLKKLIDNDKSKIGFFPGSTIGNYTPEKAKILLSNFSKILGKDNFLIIGVDLKKDIEILERAYNDSEGITARFNKNILNGINNICGNSFDEDDFDHKAFFNRNESRIEMHLVSKKDQTIDILDKKIYFQRGESIHTESSYKYSIESFKNLAESANFDTVKVLHDSKLFFSVFFLRVKSY